MNSTILGNLSLARTDEHKYIRTKNKTPFHQKYYMTDDERAELLADLNPSALMLFEFYLRQACNQDNNPDLSDQVAAERLGMSTHTIRGIRYSLRNAGWIFFDTTGRSSVTGVKAHLYYLGKQAVADYSGKPIRFNKG